MKNKLGRRLCGQAWNGSEEKCTDLKRHPFFESDLKNKTEHTASCRNSIKPVGHCYCIPDKPQTHAPTPKECLECRTVSLDAEYHGADCSFFKKPLHTDTPWINLGGGSVYGKSMTMEDDRYVLTTRPNGRCDSVGGVLPEDEANAAFIVRAVNAYEKDQEIKRELLAEVKEEVRMLSHFDPKSIRLAHLLSVIAKAEGK